MAKTSKPSTPTATPKNNPGSNVKVEIRNDVPKMRNPPPPPPKKD
jgi:hypothetical protein